MIYFGHCHRFPPTYESEVREDMDIIPTDGFPRTMEFHFCGEHPSFPTYLASLKAPSEEPK